ncbi:alkyl sulfatase BDS1-like metallo-beta-lactamase superfamily hydrolase [Bacillus pakistanensis]|uniref:Alkyl sulfatase BDS1-like metallo-beta-lactamase superfamily hydrolase n=1 Tax=Rossellomorea pakistanensis TaxID=992288 RepID=A0ABS2NI79_9BACI|nr:alkyl sulfatase dimerization domain-containing protein [Bacillus pakistanensis]MBM7587578.1 alkyl sulfatase BDS1-like metallo-beta-lactamase superfamily hydrolase [Bacillus pakistanensis]
MISKISNQSMSATSFTKKANLAVYDSLNFDNRQDFEDAKRGFIAPLESTMIKNDSGDVVWDIDNLEFLNSTAPDTVNPSLWRNAQLQAISGLFEVVEGVYQVRGQSIATTFFIEGKQGVIVCDALASTESAKAAMELYYKYRPRKPVSAIIISQSHADHFAGIQAVLKYAENPAIPIIVPQHFTEEVLSENVLLGTIMARRAEYQFGKNIPDGRKGSVSIGIGPTMSSGTMSFEMPTVEIENEIQTMEIDGINFRFLLTPNTEAPAEMHFYIQEYKALFVSENANQLMHQIYTVRGAKTRDALHWANSLEKTIDLFENEEIDALLMIHAWPVWGKARALQHLKLQRDLYKYMHDQTVRLANHGYTMDEIAETINLPKSLDTYWGNRGYYGTLKHNSKGIYNFYLGYYSAHPSDLDPLPQVEAGLKYVEYMGGADTILKQAKADFDNGEYRWVAQVLKNVVMAEPDNSEAKNLLADAFEQLGYQAESANWRNIYLVGASELRNGMNKDDSPLDVSGIINHMPVDNFLKLIAIKLNGPKADGKKITLNVTLTNSNQKYTINLDNAVLTYKTGKLDSNPDISLILDQMTFYGMGLRLLSPEQAVAAGNLIISGDQTKLTEFLSLLDEFDRFPNIVTP